MSTIDEPTNTMSTAVEMALHTIGSCIDTLNKAANDNDGLRAIRENFQAADIERARFKALIDSVAYQMAAE